MNSEEPMKVRWLKALAEGIWWKMIYSDKSAVWTGQPINSIIDDFEKDHGPFTTLDRDWLVMNVTNRYSKHVRDLKK